MIPRDSPRRADRWVHRVEAWSAIDPLVGRVHELATRATRQNTWTKNALSGTGFGHPAHPSLVVAPLGCWVGAVTADLAGERRAAARLTAAGLLAAIPAVATGLSDWTDTTGAERRVGFVHLVGNLTTIVLYSASWRARRRNAHKLGIAYGLLGAATATAAGWLGGHLTYSLGVGVDTTAFDGGPTEWTLVTRDENNSLAGSAGGVPLLIVEGETRVSVLADRCTHRGGPLSEGTIADGCVTCPWHGSRFSLATGAVEEGPAVAPQPVYETRSSPEGLYVRRRELRSLRTNPVRAARLSEPSRPVAGDQDLYQEKR
jgi:nitrite reductase/ring-hydroxylating ferredoxin subunit/uncharacterized membrane protein